MKVLSILSVILFTVLATAFMQDPNDSLLGLCIAHLIAIGVFTYAMSNKYWPKAIFMFSLKTMIISFLLAFIEVYFWANGGLNHFILYFATTVGTLFISVCSMVYVYFAYVIPHSEL